MNQLEHLNTNREELHLNAITNLIPTCIKLQKNTVSKQMQEPKL
jgi:hypothetical protein